MINFIPKIVYNAGAGDITLNFSYPPTLDPFDENITPQGVEQVSGSGDPQFNLYYLQKNIGMTFKMLTKAEIDALRTFYVSWALLGNSFKYYPSASETDYEIYRLSKKEFHPVRSFNNRGDNDFNYQLPAAFLRVYP